MVATTHHRGHKIECRIGADVWTFVDTGKSVKDTWEEMPCGKCGEANTEKGHDPCLGTLPGVINACCGHGTEKDAYVMFTDKSIVRGLAARMMIDQLTQLCKER